MLKIYDYTCWKCNKTVERYVKDIDEPQDCVCGQRMGRKIPAPKGTGNEAHSYLKKTGGFN